MKHYCGIDLHSNNHVVVVIDEKDKVVYEKFLSNDLLLTLQALSPYQYCCSVDSTRTRDGKKKGKGNAKTGKKYLSWVFSEAAHFAIQYEPMAKRFYERKKAKTNGIIAIRAIARKLARACWMMLKHQMPYDSKLMFPG